MTLMVAGIPVVVGRNAMSFIVVISQFYKVLRNIGALSTWKTHFVLVRLVCVFTLQVISTMWSDSKDGTMT